MLVLTQTLRQFGIDVVLRSALCRHVQVAALTLIAVLLALPHERLFLGGDLEHGRVKLLQNWVDLSGVLVHDLL